MDKLSPIAFARTLMRLLTAFLVVSTLPATRGAVAPGELVNISVRTQVGSGDAVLIAGFVVSGEGQRPILIRAVGPTLGAAPFNIPGVLDDPSVSLFRDNALVAENNDWANDAQLASIFSRLGAFALAPDSKDAALLAPLSAGLYTAVARGNGGATGDLLLEVYDATESGSGSGPAINNLSLRADLPPAATMVTGFVINGSGPKRLLIRAIGPSLARFGVENVLENPRIRLFTGSTDVALNDDWTEADNADAIVAASGSVGAFSLTRDARDAAVLTTVQPGPYTLHVTSADPEDHGIVLVEVYSADPVLAAPATNEPEPPNGLPRITVFASDQTASESGDTATIKFHRSGSTDAPLTIDIAWSGTATAGVDYTTLPAQITIPTGVSETSLEVVALADNTLEPPESVIATVTSHATYQASDIAVAGVLINDDPPADTSGWQAEFFNNRDFSGEPVLVRTDSAIDFDWDSDAPAPEVDKDNFSVRWTGVVVPSLTSDYTFVVSGDDTVRLWIDGQLVLDRPYTWRETAVVMPLEGGVPHQFRFELVEEWGRASAHLEWFGGGMGRHPLDEAVPLSTSAPAAVGLDRTTAIVGEPFVSYVQTVGSATSYSAAGLPPGLAINSQSGVISGTPTTAGGYNIWIDARNANGGGSTQVVIQVLAPGGSATRETFAAIAPDLTIPYDATPETSQNLTSAEYIGASAAGTERIRGYITAPETGNYRFWLSASGPARFRFADSDEPGDRVLRARVEGATGPRAWTVDAGQASPPLRLTAGERYFFEIVHACTAGSDHVSLGWMRPGQTGATPFEVVPGYVLSPYENEAILADGSTVYLANLRPEGVTQTSGFGVASIILDPDRTHARVALRYGGLTSDPTNIQIYYGGPDASGDLPVRSLPRESSDDYTWTLADVGGLTVDDILEAMGDGRLFVLIQTADHPTGELRGQFGPAIGSAEFQPPAEVAAIGDAPPTAKDAARFLDQATFGATMEAISHLQEIGYAAWLDEQFATPAGHILPFVQEERARRKAEDPDSDVWMDGITEGWWRNAVDGPDQLRQRVAFALSEIFVVSSDSNLGGQIDGLSVYYDMLADDAFGNFRKLLRDVTLSPAMGVYLSMVRNQKPDPAAGIYPDENYAREVMQLFTIGLNKLHPDGSLVLDSHGLPIPTYNQETIVGLAHVFTGWAFASTDPDYNYTWGPPNFFRPMQFYGEYHDEQPKLLLDSEVLPAGSTGPAELDHVVDMLFNHPNTGPFIARRMIQRLVTSDPSPGYVYRVARAFADNGAGVRGDLQAVIRAILTDPEARSTETAALQTFGKLREPLIRIAHLWRAFHATASGGYYHFSWTLDRLGQEVLQSPTVFNFFQPDYIAPGPAATAGLVAPEFQIATDGNIANLVNNLDWLAMRPADWTEDPVLTLTEEYALIDDPDALMDRLALLLLGGTMSDDLRAQLTTLLTDLPAWQDTDDRIRTVIFTLITSPDYAVQK